MNQSELVDRQLQFLDHLLNESNAIAKHIRADGDLTIETRLHIYRNAYWQRLIGVMKTDFPNLCQWLGEEIFESLAEQYVAHYPSCFSSLRDFTQYFPQFISKMSDYPELVSELAYFELRLLKSFDATDQTTITAELLQALPPESWPGLKLVLHPSVQLFQHQWNTAEVWQAIKQEQTIPAPKQQVNSILMWRNRELLTEFKSLIFEESALLKLVASGSDFASLCESILQHTPTDQAAGKAFHYLNSWINAGLLVDTTT